MGSNSPVKRAVRVAERIRAELSDVLLRGELRDPRAQGLLITEVQVTDDLQHARVYLRLLDTDVSEKRQRAAVVAIRRAAGYLRHELGTRMKLKYTPELRFFWDEGLDRAIRVHRILNEIGDEEGAGGPQEE